MVSINWEDEKSSKYGNGLKNVKAFASTPTYIFMA
jgi:hypothetical protein